MDINEVLRRRSDLSTFLVHLTRDGENETAKDRLKSILASGTIEARNIFGQARSTIIRQGGKFPSQKCICFTETPIEYVNLLLQKIEKRNYSFKPYGIVITKKVGRNSGVNPVWYIDITPGRTWLTNNVNNLITQAMQAGNFDQSDIAAITPFIEQMGVGANYRKEFWWEREWRKVGDFVVPRHCIAFCPEAEIDEFKAHVRGGVYAHVNFIDPSWSLEKIIAHLAGIPPADIDVI